MDVNIFVEELLEQIKFLSRELAIAKTKLREKEEKRNGESD